MEEINIEDYIQHSRIRSLRRRKRSAIESRDKRLIQLHDEEVMLSKQMRSLEWITLNPPYQRGWSRTFVLRSDVRRERKAPLYQKVLDKINTVQWSSRKDFKKKRRRFGKKVYVLREQPLCSVREYEFYSKRFTDEERLLFCEMLVRDKQGRTERLFLFNEPWRFMLQIKPNMITKVQIKSSQYERRAGEIDRLFITHHLRPRLWKLLDCSYNWKSKVDEVNPMMNVSFATILNEHWPGSFKNIESNQNPDHPGVFLFVINTFPRSGKHLNRTDAFYLLNSSLSAHSNPLGNSIALNSRWTTLRCF